MSEKNNEDTQQRSQLLRRLYDNWRFQEIYDLVEIIFNDCNLNFVDDQIEAYLRLVVDNNYDYLDFDNWDLELNCFEDWRKYYHALGGCIPQRNFPYKYFFHEKLNNAAVYLAHSRLIKSKIDFSMFDVHVISYVADIRQYEDKIETLEHAVNYTVKIYIKDNLNTPKGFYRLMPEYAEEKINL